MASLVASEAVATSDDERRAWLTRVPTEDLRVLLEETADPALEDEVRAQLRART